MPKGGCWSPEIGIGPADVTLSWKEVCPARKSALPAVEMQVNMELEFMFMASMASATAPPQPTRSPLPRFEAMACHAAV